MKKYWIIGNNERGDEVIKALEELGGVNIFSSKGDCPSLIYYMNPITNVINQLNVGCSQAVAIMWSGEELKLPELKLCDSCEGVCKGNETECEFYTKKLEPKFKVGDKVRCKDNNDLLVIKEVNFEKGLYKYEFTEGTWDWEDVLIPANTLKKFDHVMCSDDGIDWDLRQYCRRDAVYYHETETEMEAITYTYIVPLSDFDFNDLENNIKRSVV